MSQRKGTTMSPGPCGNMGKIDSTTGCHDFVTRRHHEKMAMGPKKYPKNPIG